MCNVRFLQGRQISPTKRNYIVSFDERQAGVNRRLRRLLSSRAVPDLGDCDDVAEFLSRANATDASDSEGEDGAAARVTLAQDLSQVKGKSPRNTVL